MSTAKQINVIQALGRVQSGLVVPKTRYNSFSEFYYRNADDICKAAKPLAMKEGAIIILNDSAELIGDRHYIKAEARFIHPDGEFSTEAFAQEPASKPKMSPEQVTASASSFARKTALCGLLLLDDEQDADETNDEGKDLSYIGKLQSEIRDAMPKKVVMTVMRDFELHKLSDLPEKDYQIFKKQCEGLIKSCEEL